jgi:rhodanese-related sulfurtransferase
MLKYRMDIILLFIIALMFVVVVVFPSSSTAQQQQQQQPTIQITTLNATTFKQLIDDTTTKWFDVIVDVRTLSEYTTGHINGSTLVESLASYNTTSQVSTPDALRGCEYCNIVVYCRSGSRATDALQHLITAGYKGQLYNGLGVSQWTDAGYALVVDTVSIVPPCTTNTTVSEQCEVAYNNSNNNNNNNTSVKPPVSAPSNTVTTSPSTTTSDGPRIPRIILWWKSILNMLRTLVTFFTN